MAYKPSVGQHIGDGSGKLNKAKDPRTDNVGAELHVILLHSGLLYWRYHNATATVHQPRDFALSPCRNISTYALLIRTCS